MKYQAIYDTKGGSVTLHSLHCTEFERPASPADVETFDAPNHWSAAVEAWGHDSNPEFLACSEFTIFAECLAKGYTPPGRRAKRGALPFDINNDTAAEIIVALMGKTLRWVNAVSGGEEYASLYPEGPRPVKRHGVFIDTYPHHYTEVRQAPDGSRQILFIDSGKGRRDGSTGFRAVRLDSIVSVK